MPKTRGKPQLDQARIAPATLEDLPAIAALAAVVWRACYPGMITGEQIDYMLDRMYALDTLREEILSQGVHYDRLLLDHELAGFASYGPTNEPGAFKLHKLYLHPDLHGRGLGTMLLQHCEREARRLGALRLLLNVNKRNVKAIRAYQRNGFATVQSVVTDIGGGFVMDDYVLAKETAVSR